MTVSPVVHQVDGRQQVGLEQLTLPVEEELAPLGVDVALNLSAVVLELVEGDPGVDVLVKILHVVNLEKKPSYCSSVFSVEREEVTAPGDQTRLRVLTL